MTTIIGVKFRNVSKIYYFNPGDFDVHYNDHVIVETARGIFGLAGSGSVAYGEQVDIVFINELLHDSFCILAADTRQFRGP